VGPVSRENGKWLSRRRSLFKLASGLQAHFLGFLGVGHKPRLSAYGRVRVGVTFTSHFPTNIQTFLSEKPSLVIFPPSFFGCRFLGGYGSLRPRHVITPSEVAHFSPGFFSFFFFFLSFFFFSFFSFFFLLFFFFFLFFFVFFCVFFFSPRFSLPLNGLTYKI